MTVTVTMENEKWTIYIFVEICKSVFKCCFSQICSKIVQHMSLIINDVPKEQNSKGGWGESPKALRVVVMVAVSG